jgi:hypothetical protein
MGRRRRPRCGRPCVWGNGPRTPSPRARRRNASFLSLVHRRAPISKSGRARRRTNKKRGEAVTRPAAPRSSHGARRRAARAGGGSASIAVCSGRRCHRGGAEGRRRRSRRVAQLAHRPAASAHLVRPFRPRAPRFPGAFGRRNLGRAFWQCQDRGAGRGRASGRGRAGGRRRRRPAVRDFRRRGRRRTERRGHGGGGCLHGGRDRRGGAAFQVRARCTRAAPVRWRHLQVSQMGARSFLAHPPTAHPSHSHETV